MLEDHVVHEHSALSRSTRVALLTVIEEYFDTVSGEDDWNPRYNIAPTHPVPVIRENPKESRRELSLVRWGLIPSWAKDPTKSFRSDVSM